MDKVSALLVQLADKLGTTAEHLWAVLVRQAPIEGVGYLVFYAALCAAWFLLSRWHSKLAKDPDSDDLVIAFAFCLLLVGVVTIGAFFTVPTMLACFINPEYWAAREVLGAIKGK